MQAVRLRNQRVRARAAPDSPRSGTWNSYESMRRHKSRRWPLSERGPSAEVRNLHRHATDLLKYLHANQDSLPDYGERQRAGEPFSTGWVESAINEIIANRMAKAQQMRWNRWTVQPFLAVRTAVLNDTLADSFRGWFRGFRPVAPNVPELRAA